MAVVVVPQGETVAGYTIEGLAGSGGMGVVYRATDADLGRTVALKLIAPERADDPGLREMFVRESLTAASLEHPNIIPIYRSGEDAGRLYIAMRFVEGASLQELIAAEPGGMPPGRAARIVARVADALDAAHARGLVHRDVKPANILIADPDGDEWVYLTDFGLSVARARRGAGAGGGWAGTLGYLAPEQIDGGSLDARTDVYALGCVLFHALTGRTPFPAADADAVLEAQRTQPPPVPSSLVPGLPPAMDEVVRRALAARPEDRFASAGELGRAALAARYDVVLLTTARDQAAGEAIGASLDEAGLHPLIAAGDGASTAEGVRASGACVVAVGREGLGDWARPGLSAARELASRDRSFRLVLVLLPGGPDAADPGLSYLASHPWVDLRAGVADGLADGGLLRALRGADVPAGLPQETGECPYRGLEAFREEDTALFFGREQDSAVLIERLRTTRFVAVLGASGSGKSSLVQAGLLPAVRRGAIPGGEAWRVLEMIPGDRPLAALAAALGRLAGAGAPSAADLAADERALDLAAARALEGRPDGERVLLVADQLEEAFTLCSDEGERAAFLGNLVYAATIPGGRVVVVTAMRADFYHRLAEHPEMRALASTHQHLVGPMDARALRRAIEEPARRAGLELEPGLTRRILTDVSDRPGTLPLLEHLLMELWQRRRGRTLTLEAYAESGGVEGALARRANAVYGGMDPDRQAVARRILLRLTQPGEGTEDTRRRATRAELAADPGEDAEVAAVLDALTGARLLTAGHDPASGEPVVEVTHEALIRGWPELRGWIDEDRDQLRLHRRLSDAVTEWEGAGRDEGLLYRGARLATWQERDRSALNPAERGFLDAGDARAARDRATRRRRVRLTVGGLAVAVAAIAAVAVFALLQRNDATDQRDVALSRQIAAGADTTLASNPELSLLLARDAYGHAPTAQAEQALRQSVSESKVRFAFAEHDGPVRGLAADGDGTLVASAGDDGTVRLWDPRRPDAPARVLEGHSGPVEAVAITPSGTVVASAGADGTVRLWDGTDGRLTRTVPAGGDPLRAVALSADGRVLAVGGDDGVVRLWRRPGAPPVVLMRTGMPIQAVAVSRDGRLVAAGGDETLGDHYPARVWEAATGRLVRTGNTQNGTVNGLAFDPAGGVVYSASQAGSIVGFPIDGGAPRTFVAGADNQPQTSVSVSPDGRAIAGGGGDGTARVWPVEGASGVTRLPGHRATATAVVFVPGSSLVLSASEDGTVRGSVWTAGSPGRRAGAGAGVQFAQDDPRAVDVVTVDTETFAGGLSRWTPGGATVPPAWTSAGESGWNWGVAGDPGIVAMSLPDRIEVLRLGSGGTVAERRALTGGGEGIYDVMAFSAGSGWLAAGQFTGGIHLWNLDAPGAQPVSSADEGELFAIAVTAGGAVAAGYDNGTVRIWDRPGSAARIIDVGSQRVASLAFSRDGAHLAAGGRDGRLTVVSFPEGREEAVLRNGGLVQDLDFSADGRLLLATLADAVRAWDWERGITIDEWPAPGAFGARFDGDGRRVVAGTETETLLWTCDVCGPVDRVLALAGDRVTRDLTPDERAEFELGS